MSRFIKLAAVSALALAAAGCSTQPPGPLTPASNFGMYSLHQPVVEHTNYVFDVSAGPNGVSPAEQERLAAWFQSINVRYGDHVTIDQPRGYESARARQDVARVAGDFGLLISADGAPVTEGDVPAGVVRVVASRASAHVDNCPQYGDPGIESPVRTGTNYGCATNSNLAAMVANPDDLVHGQEGSGRDSSVVAGRAIRVYRDRVPTGTQPLPTTTTRAGSSQ
ncbi:MAG TPA: CpaD family pilus assembly lipoprotein [Allosphingosinicella sp.]